MPKPRRSSRPVVPDGNGLLPENGGERLLDSSHWNLPNLLSALRLLSGPALLALAWRGSASAFLALFGVALLTDVLDGVAARRLGLESEFGARLDQYADFAIWAVFPVGAYWLWTDLVAREAAYVILALVCLLIPSVVAFAKYRQVPGYHTFTAKLSAVGMGIAVPMLLIYDIVEPFRAAALFLLVAAIDELGITAVSSVCRHDVPSLFHAVRFERQRTSGSERFSDRSDGAT